MRQGGDGVMSAEKGAEYSAVASWIADNFNKRKPASCPKVSRDYGDKSEDVSRRT